MFTYYFKISRTKSLFDFTTKITKTTSLSSATKCDNILSAVTKRDRTYIAQSKLRGCPFTFDCNIFHRLTNIMATERNTYSSPLNRLQYFQGSLVGALIGDCFGSKFEGSWRVNPISVANHLATIEKCFTTSRSTEDEATGQEILYTDDTAMLRSIAASLIERKEYNAVDVAKRFTGTFFKEPDRGYGYNITTVFEKLRDQRCEDPYRPAREQFDGSGSHGNGGAMRIAPAALFTDGKSEEDLRELTENLTLLTHTHRNGIVGALLESFAVRFALEHSKKSGNSLEKVDVSEFTAEFLDSLEKILRLVEEQETEPMSEEECSESSRGFQQEESSVDDLKGPYLRKIDRMKHLLKDTSNTINIAKVVEELGNDVSALNSVPMAVYCFLRSLRPIEQLHIPSEYNSFSRCIMLSICMGGDTDTIASMAGAISGAYHGVELIPTEWQKACEGLTDALKMAQELYQIAHPHQDIHARGAENLKDDCCDKNTARNDAKPVL